MITETKEHFCSVFFRNWKWPRFAASIFEQMQGWVLNIMLHGWMLTLNRVKTIKLHKIVIEVRSQKWKLWCNWIFVRTTWQIICSVSVCEKSEWALQPFWQYKAQHWLTILRNIFWSYFQFYLSIDFHLKFYGNKWPFLFVRFQCNCWQNAKMPFSWCLLK